MVSSFFAEEVVPLKVTDFPEAVIPHSPCTDITVACASAAGQQTEARSSKTAKNRTTLFFMTKSSFYIGIKSHIIYDNSTYN